MIGILLYTKTFLSDFIFSSAMKINLVQPTLLQPESVTFGLITLKPGSINIIQLRNFSRKSLNFTTKRSAPFFNTRNVHVDASENGFYNEVKKSSKGVHAFKGNVRYCTLCLIKG